MKAVLSKCLRAFKADGQLRFGVIGVIVLLLVIILAPILAPHDPYSYEFVRLLPPGPKTISWAPIIWDRMCIPCLSSAWALP